ncbi:programmed cell death protein 5 [Empidonax traillii]|uniref:programmed cell death protein 5 n=1 Tax=Empidonax traillii TaxID=164674 RepID=UPI000FFD45DA|nr:programmed cell death protein 5 [Empidonax traillii]
MLVLSQLVPEPKVTSLVTINQLSNGFRVTKEPPGDPSQQEAKQREAEIRNTILAQVLDQAARARLSNLALVKPDKAKAVENYLIQMARFGQLAGKVSEQGLIEILEKVSQQTEKKTTVKFNRRRVLDSDEEDDY